MTTLYILPNADHYCMADDLWTFTRELMVREIKKAEQRGHEAALTPLIDRLVVLHIYRKEHDTDTELAIKEMVDWEIQIALDPQVSSDAQALIDRGREEAMKDPDLTIAYMSGFADGKKVGREAMREECVKVCETRQETCGECPETAQYCADEIRTIK